MEGHYGAQRIVVYGTTGSGKTHLAKRISAATGIPFHEVDNFTWRPGWQEVPHEDQRARIAEICLQDSWIIDSMYGSFIDIPLRRAELIVCLDYPRVTSFARLVRRSIARVVTKQPVCNGNIETCRRLFSHDSILIWHSLSFRRKRERMRGWQATSEGPKAILMRSPRDTERWLEGLVSLQDT